MTESQDVGYAAMEAADDTERAGTAHDTAGAEHSPLPEAVDVEVNFTSGDQVEQIIISIPSPRTPIPEETVDRYVRSAVNMQRSVEALGPALAAVETPVSPQLAASMQATENLWREMDAEFGLLSSTEVSERSGSRSPNRSYASEQRASGKLLAIRRPGGLRYPGFQIDPQEHVVRPVMQDLIRVAREADRTEASLAIWLYTRTGYLDGDRPVDRFADPDTVVDAARQSFNVQW